MKKIGLTGNIGSGKTLVAEIFRSLGIPVFHADQEAKTLYLLPDVRQKVTEITGTDIFNKNGELNRKKMAEIVFNDPEKLRQVNETIHPMVREQFLKFSEEHHQEPYIIYEAAILIESGYHNQLDGLIVVYAPEDMRIERILERDGATTEEIISRIKNQVSDEKKMKLSDWTIYNDGSRLVIPQVLEIDRRLRQLPS